MDDKSEVREEPEVHRKPSLFDGPSTATWKVDNDTFRRLARTGEYTPDAEKAEAKE